jgi:6-pyruvoyltetrahydropterin/6-carboxytetrahydropterin synthase
MKGNMFEISVKTHFSAAHHLRGYKGICADPHGHNWDVEVFIAGAQLDMTGFLVDFRVLKKRVKAILGELDHHDLNTLPAFRRQNPTSENLARYLYETLSGRVNCPRYRINRVTVGETPGTTASYWAEADA